MNFRFLPYKNKKMTILEDIEKLFDDILFQLSKGNTIEKLKKGVRWDSFEQVKEWENRFGYQFHIYSNDHLINKEPHFHLRKVSENIDCKFSFSGKLFECNGSGKLDKKTISALNHILTLDMQKKLYDIWNQKNPNLKV